LIHKKLINNQQTGKTFPLSQFGKANMETISEFKSCLKNIYVLWTSHLFSTWEVEKTTGIATGYNCFRKRIVLLFLGGEWGNNKGDNS
jgi:hypothetical protein